MLFWDYSKAYLAEAWSGCANSNAFEVMYVVSGEVLNSSCEERSDGTDAAPLPWDGSSILLKY